MKNLLLIAILAFMVINKTFAQNTLNASDLKPYGRARMTNGNLELIGSAVHFGFSFEGKRCEVYTSLPNPTGHDYLQYELDGVYQKKLRVDGNSSGPLVIEVPASGKHTIWIYKNGEALTGPVFISKITAHHIRPVEVPKAPLIEFIGNSITCGAQADSAELPCGTGEYLDHHNAYMAYGPSVARMLGANYILSSVSGIGVYRTWNQDGPSMPQVYEKTDLHLGSTDQWDFTRYTPKVVSIALGTNDLSPGDGKTPRKPFSADEFNAAYENFIKLVKSKYPKAHIALLSSPMVNSTERTALESCLTTIKAYFDTNYPNDYPVETFFFVPIQPQGCATHPSVSQQQDMAKVLMPFYKTLLDYRDNK